MIDREKVIKGLECCADGDCKGHECPYHHNLPEDWNKFDCNTELARDALELLKEQEYKTGYWENGHCTCCGEDIASKLDTWTDVQKFSFCPKCGAKMEVKLDD